MVEEYAKMRYDAEAKAEWSSATEAIAIIR